MTFDPVTQAEDIAIAISTDIGDKYAKGQIEHGGNFFEKPTVRNIREEVIDLVSYTHVLELHRNQISDRLFALKSSIVNKTYTNDLLLADVNEIIQLVEKL
jgi:hypothetical protein